MLAQAFLNSIRALGSEPELSKEQAMLGRVKRRIRRLVLKGPRKAGAKGLPSQRFSKAAEQVRGAARISELQVLCFTRSFRDDVFQMDLVRFSTECFSKDAHIYGYV